MTTNITTNAVADADGSDTLKGRNVVARPPMGCIYFPLAMSLLRREWRLDHRLIFLWIIFGNRLLLVALVVIAAFLAIAVGCQ